MEIIKGKQTFEMNHAMLVGLAQNHTEVWLDIGTGDGQFVKKTALSHPDILVIGIDACRENLLATSRTSATNALYVIANALNLPAELDGIAHQISINFPWGSLLQGLLSPEPALVTGLQRLRCGPAKVEIRLNESALREAGWELDKGSLRVADVLTNAGFRMKPVTMLRSPDLRKIATSWAKRLAYSRLPKGVYLTAG